MEMQLAGKMIVVVGAARGIGRAIAEAFAQEQASVALLERDRGYKSSCGRGSGAV